MEFLDLGLHMDLCRALQDVQITTPTPIQVEAIPPAIKGRDIIGKSKTGSGKTAAFGLPILHRIQPGEGLQAMILAPTRELAVQISEELEKWAKHRTVNVATIYGGVGFGPQLDALQYAEIVVGTPGRILDHMNRGTLVPQTIKMFALDEADKMVDMGFIRDVERIISSTDQDRQVMLFSATISTEIRGLQNKFMNDPVNVEGEEHVAEDFLEQTFYNLKPHQKFSYLVHLLNKNPEEKVIVFCSTRSNVEMVTKNLRRQGIKAEMIHGKMTQNRRLKVVELFKQDQANVLVGSAVAARGLDIQGVRTVYNYDLANDPQEYVHRVGRTARAGETGKAITLLSERDHDTFREVLYRYNLKVTELPLEEFQKLPFDARRPPRRGGNFRGNRNGGHSRHHRNRQRV